MISLSAKVVEDKPVDKVRCPSAGAKKPNLNFITKHGIEVYLPEQPCSTKKKNIVQQHSYTTHEMQEDETVTSHIVLEKIQGSLKSYKESDSLPTSRFVGMG